MYSKYDSAFGMESPVSLNEIDGSEQFKTFSEGQRRTRDESSARKKIPVLKINLKSLIAKRMHKVIPIGSFGASQNIQRKSIIRQAKYANKLARQPFAEKNTLNTKITSKAIEFANKYRSPCKRKLSISLEKPN